MARLGGLDASLLFLEFGRQTMNICTLIELDTSTVPGGYSFEKFHSYLADRLAALPELRVKLADSRWNLDNPVWVDDLDFELDRHLHRVVLAPPCGRRELSDLAAAQTAGRLDRGRPLWEMWVIECGADCVGPDPRVAVLLKQHHAIMDGASDTDLMGRLCSTEVDAPAPAHLAGAGSATTGEIARDGAKLFARRPFHISTRLLPALARSIATSAKLAFAARAMSSPFRAPATSFNGNATEVRNLAFVQLDLSEVKTAKNAFGVKVNDVVLALLAGALRDHLLDRGELPASDLLAMVPIAVEDRSATGGANQLSAAFCTLHTGIADPVARLRAIAAASASAKHHSAALGPALLRDTLQYVSPKLLGLAMRLYIWSGASARRPVCNISVSNVPAPPVQWYFGAAKVKAMYGLPPVMHGIGLHAGVSSLNGKLEIGLMSCPELLPDLWSVADRIPDALKEILNAAT
ncbi:MAG: wax ester/triacylglycerol synthase family O-acyltransferase [Mycolicibacterium cosmeticum]|nr:wax ester/triacylglycerol synthase family O-acyltransferase [Mycolicibacterium cosmeticum]